MKHQFTAKELDQDQVNLTLSKPNIVSILFNVNVMNKARVRIITSIPVKLT